MNIITRISKFNPKFFNMFYRYDRNNLVFKKDWKTIKIISTSVLILMFGSFLLGRFAKFSVLDEYEKELLIISLEEERNSFSRDKLVEELKRLNVKYPHIVMAQAIIESGNFKSRIFKENNNLFGMKEAGVRVNTAVGTQHGHAYYSNWMELMYDYAFNQSRYLGNIKSEQQYFSYLGNSYAEADHYVKTLKTVIERENLKSLF